MEREFTNKSKAPIKNLIKRKYTFELNLPLKTLLFTIDGRCDGLLVGEDGLTIDEIKSTSLPLDQLESDGLPVHWAQAKMYAYIYAKDHHLEKNLCPANLCTG